MLIEKNVETFAYYFIKTWNVIFSVTYVRLRTLKHISLPRHGLKPRFSIYMPPNSAPRFIFQNPMIYHSFQMYNNWHSSRSVYPLHSLCICSNFLTTEEKQVLTSEFFTFTEIGFFWRWEVSKNWNFNSKSVIEYCIENVPYLVIFWVVYLYSSKLVIVNNINKWPKIFNNVVRMQVLDDIISSRFK